MRFLFLLICSSLVFPVAADQTNHRVGFVNVSQILSKAPQVAAFEAELKADYEKREEDILKEEERLETKKKHLIEQQASLNIIKRNELEREILYLRRQIKRSRQELEEDITFRKSEKMDSLRLLIAESIERVAVQRKIDLVFESAVVYASDKVNITADVLQHMQIQHEKNKTPK